MNVREKVQAIHRRVVTGANNGAPLHIATQERYFDELNALRSSYVRLRQLRNAVGQMPASPNTLRAKVGSYLIRIVQRMLFWYTPQIVRFLNETVNG